MKTKNCINKLAVVAVIALLINIAGFTPVVAQTGVAESNPQEKQLRDTTKKAVGSPKKMFGEITEYLVKQQQFLTAQVNKKVKHRIEKAAKLYAVPGGESRVALFELPAYGSDYVLTIRSMVHGFSLTYRMFAPTAVFLDSAFHPTHFLGETKFAMQHSSGFKGIRSESNVMIDEKRREDRYVLIYTAGTSQPDEECDSDAPLTSMLSRSVERSPDGKLELELHSR
jgi:Maltose operon periplasmic protein precursor (MalM)